jgi:hypothetical protein
MVAVLVVQVAFDAKIKVLAGVAVHEFLIRQNNDTTIACAYWGDGQVGPVIEKRCDRRARASTLHEIHRCLCRFDDLRRCSNRGGHSLADAFSCASNNFAIFDESLDQPVVFSRANFAVVDTSFAEVVVAVITDAAVEMLVGHGNIALVAVH